MFFTELKVWSVLLLPSRRVVGSVATLGRGRTFGTAAFMVTTGTAGLTAEGMPLVLVIAHQQTQSSDGKEAAMMEGLCP